MGLVRRDGPLTVSISSVFTGCLVVVVISHLFFCCCCCGFYCWGFLCHFGLVVLVGFP